MAPDRCTMINVLAVHTASQRPMGADTWVHARILATLDRATHHVHAACVPARAGTPTPTFADLSQIEDLTIVPVDFGPEREGPASLRATLRTVTETLPAIPSTIKLARYIRRHDIAILHTSDRPRDAMICVLLSRITRAKSIVHVHVLHSHWMGRFLRWAIARADARVAVSEFVCDSLESADPGLHDSYAVLNAIDPDHWGRTDDATAVRDELGLPASAPTILTVCRLFEEKGVRRLIHAVAGIRRDFPDVRLLVAGIDLAAGEPHLESLRADVARLGLEDHVTFLGRRTDIAQLMAASDIFAMPSFEEPFGLVYIEAMACGLPVVALDNGGAREVVDHGVHGLLSEPDDAAGLAHNIGVLLADPAMRDEMGEAGRAHVLAHFTLERQAADMARVYRLVASKLTIRGK